MNYYNDYGSAYENASDVMGTTSTITGILSVLSLVFGVIMIAISVVSIISMWKVFKKAGKPGWACIVPYYNFYVMTQIAGLEWWYLLLLLVPFANIYAMYKIYDGIAKNFGKSTGFTFGLIFAPYVFFPLLAFKNDIVYMGDGGSYSVPMNNVSVNDGFTAQSATVSMDTNVSTFESVQNTAPEQNVMPNTQTNIVQGFNEVVQEQPIVNQTPDFGFENASEPTPVASEMVQNVAPTFNEATVVNEQPVVMQKTTFDTTQTANPFDFANFNSAPSINEVQTPVQNIVNEPAIEQINTQNIQSEPFGFNNNVNNVPPVMNTDVNNNVESIVEEVQEQPNTVSNEQHTSLWSNQNNNSSNNGQF